MGTHRQVQPRAPRTHLCIHRRSEPASAGAPRQRRECGAGLALEPCAAGSGRGSAPTGAGAAAAKQLGRRRRYMRQHGCIERATAPYAPRQREVGRAHHQAGLHAGGHQVNRLRAAERKARGTDGSTEVLGRAGPAGWGGAGHGWLCRVSKCSGARSKMACRALTGPSAGAGAKGHYCRRGASSSAGVAGAGLCRALTPAERRHAGRHQPATHATLPQRHVDERPLGCIWPVACGVWTGSGCANPRARRNAGAHAGTAATRTDPARGQTDATNLMRALGRWSAGCGEAERPRP